MDVRLGFRRPLKSVAYAWTRVDGIDRRDTEIAGPPIPPEHAVSADCFRVRVDGAGHFGSGFQANVGHNAVLFTLPVDE